MIQQIGVDIIENDRFKPFLNHPRKIAKILSPDEIIQFNKLTHVARQLSYLASRFAAKEALIKAGFTFLFHEISILNHEDGRPYVAWDKNDKVFLSLSHSNTMSIAFVIVEKV